VVEVAPGVDERDRNDDHETGGDDAGDDTPAAVNDALAAHDGNLLQDLAHLNQRVRIVDFKNRERTRDMNQGAPALDSRGIGKGDKAVDSG
jgi:hypothetical protein